MLVLNVATKYVHEKQSHQMNPSKGGRWEKLQQIFLLSFSALVNSKCAQGNDAETKGNHEEGASERARSSDAAPRSGRSDHRAEPSPEPSREPSRGSNRAGPSGHPAFRAGNGQAEATGRRAGGRPGQAVCDFLAILCYSQSGDDPKEDLARFGYKLKMKVILFLKIRLYFLAINLNHVHKYGEYYQKKLRM
jgi:hypothetical protein